jgi:HSP20 family protein
MLRSPVFPELVSLSETVDRVMNDAFTNRPFQVIWSRNGNSNTAVRPLALDLYVTDDKAVILAAVPGLQPDDMDLSIHENTVNLSGTVRSATGSEEAKRATWYLNELGSGTFRRTVTLPFPVNADEAEATFEQGILRVELPKVESAKPRKIAIHAAQPKAVSAGETAQRTS